MLLNKKLIFSIVLSFILIGGGYLLVSGAEDGPEISRTEIIKDKNVFSINTKGIGSDTDKDGLLDWEETLWGTDPQDRDSDNDGTSDGEEVEDKRDPTKPGPDDSLQSEIASPFNPDVDLNNTGRFGVDFLSAYLSLKDVGRLGDNSADALFGALSGNISEISKLPEYKESDLKIISDNSAVAIKKYGNDFGIIFISEAINLQDNELGIILEIIEGIERPEVLVPLVNTHQRILNKIIDIKVPSEAANLHLAFINNYSAVVESIENMAAISNEPLLTVIGISQYKEATDRLTRTKNNLSSYFDLRGVNFSSDDPGVIFQ